MLHCCLLPNRSCRCSPSPWKRRMDLRERPPSATPTTPLLRLNSATPRISSGGAPPSPCPGKGGGRKRGSSWSTPDAASARPRTR
uniref:Uncharacterized protein n=1 Tax=Setaria italica TaxID=4555 RepID=K4A4C8_SETIT